MASQNGHARPPRISVVMPNFNHSRFIRLALGAVLAQTRRADEIILIDDASTDDSLRIMQELAAENIEVLIVRKPTRGGALKALNEGLESASGDFITFPAADDLLRAEFLEEAESLLKCFPMAPFCSACVKLIDSEGRRFGMRPVLRPMLIPGYATAEVARSILMRGDNFFLGPVTLYRRSRLLELGGFDLSLGSSSDGMMLRRMAVRWGFCFTPRVLGAWRLHGGNYSATAVNSPEKLDHLLEADRRVIMAEPPGLFPKGYARLFERRLRFNAARLALLRRSREMSVHDKLDAICGMMQATNFDRLMLRSLQRLPYSAALSTAWLTIRLRPFSLPWIGMEVIRRSLSRGTQAS